jgi:putative transposase
MKYRLIERCRETFPIRLLCRCLRVSASGYYGWATRPASRLAQENTRHSSRIWQLHAEADGVIGGLRIWEELRYEGERTCRYFQISCTFSDPRPENCIVT